MPDKVMRIAVASREGLAVSEHFGHAKVFYIYEVTAAGCQQVDKREVAHYCLGGHSDQDALTGIFEAINVQEDWQYFLTYSGVKLPLKLVTPLQADETENRNTFFRACFDVSGRMLRCQKIVYSEVEFEHYYDYYADGVLKQVKILDADDEPKQICYNEQGLVMAG